MDTPLDAPPGGAEVTPATDVAAGAAHPGQGVGSVATQGDGARGASLEVSKGVGPSALPGVGGMQNAGGMVQIFSGPTPPPHLHSQTFRNTSYPTLTIPMHTQRGLNDREHPMQRSRRVKAEKRIVSWALVAHQRHYGKPPLPARCVLTRCAPGRGLDSDNLAGALKSVRDAIADWLEVNDRFDDIVSYRYRALTHQREYAVLVDFEAL